MIKTNKDPLQRIQLSLFVFVLGAILYYSITMLAAAGISPIQLSTATTTNTTSNEVTFFNNKGMSLNSLGKFNESITYFDKALSIDPKNVLAMIGKGNVLSNLGNNTDIGSSEFGTDEKKFGFDKDFVYTNLNNNNTQGTPTTTSPCEVTVDTITGLGNAPFGIAFDSVNERIYVTNSDDNTVSVIDTTTNTVIDTIPIGVVPFGIAYDHINQRIYVTNFGDGTVSIIDTTTNTVDLTPIMVGSGPYDIAYDRDNQRMYVTNSGDGTVSVIDTTTNTVDSTPITVGIVPFGIAYSHDNQRMYVTNGGDSTVSVIDTTTNTVVGGPITVGNGPRGIAYDSVPDKMYVANSLDETVSIINLC